MKIGFSGTQVGMTQKQINELRRRLMELRPSEFHHGDCIGADAQAHNIVRQLRFFVKVIVHPPTIPDKRANCTADMERQPLSYLERNQEIVKETEYMIFAPKQVDEVVRSGTWATYRYARSLQRPVEIIIP